MLSLEQVPGSRRCVLTQRGGQLPSFSSSSSSSQDTGQDSPISCPQRVSGGSQGPEGWDIH